MARRSVASWPLVLDGSAGDTWRASRWRRGQAARRRGARRRPQAGHARYPSSLVIAAACIPRPQPLDAALRRVWASSRRIDHCAARAAGRLGARSRPSRRRCMTPTMRRRSRGSRRRSRPRSPRPAQAAARSSQPRSRARPSSWLRGPPITSRSTPATCSRRAARLASPGGALAYTTYRPPVDLARALVLGAPSRARRPRRRAGSRAARAHRRASPTKFPRPHRRRRCRYAPVTAAGGRQPAGGHWRVHDRASAIAELQGHSRERPGGWVQAPGRARKPRRAARRPVVTRGPRAA
jgi:hypothetical protein